MDAAAELGRNPVSKHQIQSGYGDKQADAGRDCRTRLARPNSQARTGTRKIVFFVQLTTSRIGNLSWLIHTLAICDGHPYSYSSSSYVFVFFLCFLPIHSGHQVRWTYQPGSHRRKVTQDF